MTAAIAPVRRHVVVPVAPAVAFDVFTAEIGKWWPLGGQHSVFGEGTTVRFAQGRLVEESPEGTAVWGSVVEWEPPDRLRITWHPGRDGSVHTDVAVRFAAIGDGSQTLVTLEHSGWERLADPLAAHTEYRGGWVGVLGAYTSRLAAEAVASAPAVAPGPVWLLLSATPGVNAPADGDVFSHPDFAEHLAFVSGLVERGVVVGAGPIPGRTGHGMTIVRVPVGEVAEHVRAAQEDDQSVVRGLLQLDVAAWSVRMAS
jgi:uncharacterized protein YndB with AHSA1/START domain